MKNQFLKTAFIVLVSLVVIGIIAGVIFSFIHRPYMAVYLATGDIYFGRVSSFPHVTIQDPWFFRRAEDGIRDAQESRGLGDVYKRQLGRLSF